MRFSKALRTALSALLALLAIPAFAASLPAPGSEVVLDTSGRIAHRNGTDSARFDAAARDALPVAQDVPRADRMNGEPKSLRDKGPTWIVCSISQSPAVAGAETEGKMIWRLRDLIVR